MSTTVLHKHHAAELTIIAEAGLSVSHHMDTFLVVPQFHTFFDVIEINLIMSGKRSEYGLFI